MIDWMVFFSPGFRILFGEIPVPAVVLKPSGPIVPISTTRATVIGLMSPASRLVLKEKGQVDASDCISVVGQ